MIVRVNMKRLTVSYEELPEEWHLIGGRGLIAGIMNKEVPPDADPLGPDNKSARLPEHTLLSWGESRSAARAR